LAEPARAPSKSSPGFEQRRTLGISPLLGAPAPEHCRAAACARGQEGASRVTSSTRTGPRWCPLVNAGWRKAGHFCASCVLRKPAPQPSWRCRPARWGAVSWRRRCEDAEAVAVRIKGHEGQVMAVGGWAILSSRQLQSACAARTASVSGSVSASPALAAAPDPLYPRQSHKGCAKLYRGGMPSIVRHSLSSAWRRRG
jgi:hypothetical protein